MAKAPLDQLMEALEAITLEDIDTQLAEIDEQIKEAVEPLQKLRAAMLQTRKIIEVRTNGQAERKTRRASEKPFPLTAPSGESQGTSLVDRMRTYLQVAGPTKVKVIAEAMEEEYTRCYPSLNNNKTIFKKTGEGEFGLVKH